MTTLQRLLALDAALLVASIADGIPDEMRGMIHTLHLKLEIETKWPEPFGAFLNQQHEAVKLLAHVQELVGGNILEQQTTTTL
jgi:hypothetical protein